VTISSGNVTITNVSVTTANVTTLNATTVIATTANVTTANITTGNVTTANIVTANITTGNVTNMSSGNVAITGGSINGTTLGASTASTANVTTLTTSSTVTINGGTANGVAYLNGSKVLTTGSALTFDGTNFATSNSMRVTGSTASYASGAGTEITYISGSTKGGIQVYDRTASAYRDVFLDGANALFQISGTEQMRLTSTGLGIGTSSINSYSKLQIAGGGSGAIGAMRFSDSGLTNYWDIGRDNGVAGFFTITGQGTQRMCIDTSGNVGIGTSAPAVKLQVNGSLAVGSGQNISWGGAYGAGIPTMAGSASGMDFYPAGSTSGLSMRLDSSGNLGLGVTPSAWGQGRAFEISAVGEGLWGNGLGDIWMINGAYFNSDWKYSGTTRATAYRQGAGTTDGSHAWYTAPSGTAGNTISFTQAMTLTAAGNLGVGTTSPTNFTGYQTITVNGTTGGVIEAASNGTVGARIQCDTTYPGMALFAVTNNPMIFGTNATERARITSGGDLLVGMTNTTPSNALGFAVNNSNAGISYTQIQHASGTASGASYEVFYYNASPIGSITQNGTTAVAYNTSSDYRLKDNPQPLTNSGAFIDALKPKTWNWKADGSKGVGFLAHEAQVVSPGSVVGTKDAVDADGKPVMQAMEYGSAEFIANIIAELQSLRARVAQLENLKGN
jgi:hypothetical protein